ncbi:Arad-like aldolase epimerase [Lasiodiplodia theobromae]|uniref:Arad-like aldolase epimerase n=1 Tax=Lasiodiplodia theobromae TaxID=45133 RepID=UPI0015C3E677|nr:Arad-like aldolase epimerase [Lasiodiplodia theobromae]KAF4546092.1 Arad-like aldolase epimerase [Lasiodiplodia theobromae]
MAPSMSLTETLRLLITANHILHYHEIVDGFGHISVRNPHDPSTFYMSAQIAPGIVKSPDDIVLYYVANGTSVDPNAPTGYAERFIHSEVLRQWPCVGSVVHAHADEVLPFTIVEGVQMEAAFHMAGFIGDYVPVYDIARYYLPNETNHNLLVSDTHLGGALASLFGAPAPPSCDTCACPNPAHRLDSRDDNNHRGGGGGGGGGGHGRGGDYSTNHRDDDGSSDSENDNSADSDPPRTLVLMRGHGFTTVGADILTSVFRAYYIADNARLQSAAMELSVNAQEMCEDVGGNYGNIKYLSARERRDAGAMPHEFIAKAWQLWVKEVRTRGDGLYENALGWPVIT